MDIRNHSGNYGGGGGKLIPAISYGTEVPKKKAGLWFTDDIKPKKVSFLKREPKLETAVTVNEAVPVPCAVNGDVNDGVIIGNKMHHLRKYSSVTSGAEYRHFIYDLETDKWEYIGQLFLPTSNYASIAKVDNYLYAFASTSKDVYRCPLDTLKWEYVGKIAGTPAINKTTVHYRDGKLFLLNHTGTSDSSTWIYTLDVNTLEMTKSLSIGASNGYANLIADGDKFYLVFGHMGTSDGWFLYEYFPETNTVSKGYIASGYDNLYSIGIHKGVIHVVNRYSNQHYLETLNNLGVSSRVGTIPYRISDNLSFPMASYNGTLYLFTSMGVVKYDDVQKKFLIPDMLSYPPSTTGVSFTSTAIFSNTKYTVYANGEGKSFEVLDKKTNTWATITAPVTYAGNSIRLLSGDWFYQFSRISDANNFSYRYNLVTGEFDTLPAVPYPISYRTPLTEYKGDIFIFGSTTNSSYSKNILKLDMATRVWSYELSGNAIPVGFSGGTVQTVGDVSYSMGNANGNYAVYSYNHIKKVVSYMANTPGTAYYTNTASYGNIIYLPGIESAKNTLYEYDTLTNTYQSVARSPVDLYDNGASMVGGTLRVATKPYHVDFVRFMSHEPDETLVVNISETTGKHEGEILKVKMPGSFTGNLGVIAKVTEAYYFVDGEPVPIANIRGYNTAPW